MGFMRLEPSFRFGFVAFPTIFITCSSHYRSHNFKLSRAAVTPLISSRVRKFFKGP